MVYFWQAEDIVINEVELRKLKPQKDQFNYTFGRLFTDHMLSLEWTKEGGWNRPEILPYGPIKMATSATALHYGISVHEGISIVENSETGKL